MSAPLITGYAVFVLGADGVTRCISSEPKYANDIGFGGSWVPLGSGYGLSVEIQPVPTDPQEKGDPT